MSKKISKEVGPSLPLASDEVSNAVDQKRDIPFPEKADNTTVSDPIQELRNKVTIFPSYNLKDDFELFIPIQGFARFTREEMDIINHPAFQRLGEIYQLGQANLVYRGATHKRMEHVLGTVCVVQEMIEAVRENYNKLQRYPDKDLLEGLCEPLSPIECMFSRLAALLHDIGHLPAGHTLEDELRMFGKYGKHDCVRRLNLVLDRTDWIGGPAKPLRAIIDDGYSKFIRDSFPDSKIKPSDLLFHIIAKDRHNIGRAADDIDVEKDGELSESSTYSKIPNDFRINVCRDMVGNTICADLLDYLHRDWYHAGKQAYFDKRLYQYMQIRKKPLEIVSENKSTDSECFVISVGKSPRIRTDAISQILSLLQDRYGLAETILFHRTKCSAAAMLERAIKELLDQQQVAEKKSKFEEEYETKFLDYSDLGVLKTLLHKAQELHCATAEKVLNALLRREIYKPLCTKFLNEIPKSKSVELQDRFERHKDAANARFEAAKRFEREWHLPEGSLVMYCPTKEMNAKIAKVRIHVNYKGQDVIDTLDVLDKQTHEIVGEHPLASGHLDVQIQRFLELWRIHVFLSKDVLAEKSPVFLKHLKDAVAIFLFGIHSKESYEDAAISFARESSMIKDSPYYQKHPIDDLERAARWTTKSTEKYPLGVPSIISCYQ